MKALLIAIFSAGCAAQAASESLSSLLKNYYTGPFNFDGSVVRQYPENAQVSNSAAKSILVPQPAQHRNYFMTWGTEQIGNRQYLTLTESTIGTQPGDEVTARTSTFDGYHLRSSTKCYGHIENIDKDLKCVTAVKPACQNLITRYNQESAKPGEAKPDVVTSYESLARAFDGDTPKESLDKARIAEQDLERIQQNLKQALKKPASKSPQTALNEHFSASLEGLRAMNAALEMCQQANTDFDTKSDETQPAAVHR